MEEGRRSGDPSGYLVKNRSGGSGRLIVKKRGNDGAGGLGSSGSRNVFGSKKEKKRARLSMSDSGSSDDLLMPPRRRVAPETLRVCNGLSHYDAGVAEENDIGRKRIRGGESVRNNEVALIGRSGEDFSERKRKMLDVFEFDEYDGSDEELVRKPFDDGRMDGRRYIGSMNVGRSGLEREYETGSSRHPVVDRRNSPYLERIRGVNRGDHSERDRTRPPVPFYGNKYDSDGHIRVQGKNGVLKVMVNKKKKVSGSSSTYDPLEVEEKRKGSRSEDTFKRNVLTRPTFYTQPKVVERAGPSVNKLKNPNKLKSSSAKRLPVRNGTIKDEDSEDSGTSLKLGPLSVENLNTRKTPLSNRSLKGQEEQSEDSDTSLKLGPKNAESRKFMKHASSGGEIVPSNELSLAKSKEGKVKRGTGTEKQKLREKIRGMLLSAGWTIDYRPRRNRDYLDAVYINPNGTAYWSIIKAYDALLKQLNEEEEAAKAKGDASFRPLPDEVLSQLTRKTRKKMEKEMKKKQRDANESANARETVARRSSSSRHDEESIDSGSHEEKLSSFIKQSGSGKSVKSRINGDGSLNPNTKGQSSTHYLDAGVEPSGVNSHQGRRTRKLGRCTLLVRNSNDGLNSDSDGYVPYSGKRTVLSWLIDCGAVQLSQKVRYMNRRRTKVMLEGWVTRDGIHCGCCSKILTVLKFEIHAGSKQRQPFQNICLDSGVSLLECQIDAWNRQESLEHTGFHSVDVDGDDPNDDTCGLCGDGGDLICCDTCPSTFHLSCLDIEMLPPGDWHCPHCTCKFCGLAGEDSVEGDDTTVCGLLTCSLCAKKYHTSCSQGVDALSIDTDGPVPCFCGKTCKEVFEQLQKYLGVKHELESGLSWCLIHRTDVDLDITPQGLPSRVECNSKLAVALSVMDECFLPVVDRRSGINLLHSVLYNCGSNFNRLNFSGFYAAILERGDEIIAAASIRLHGTQLAEMPFIGTRHIYRRQGMCRRLFCAIESALCSLKVQRMIIPAISELTPTWTGVFGFTNIDRSLKQELKSISMLVFPGIDMLQKQLLEQENKSENRTIATVVRGMKFEDNQCITPDTAIRSDIDSSAKHDPDECDDGDLEHASRANVKASTRDSDLQRMDVPLNNTSLRSSSSGSSDENKNSAPLEEETVHTDSDPVETRSPCIADKVDSMSVSSSAEKNVQSCIQGNVSHMNSDSGDLGVALDDASVMNGSFDPDSEQKNSVLVDRTICADMESGSKLAELIPDNKCPISADSNGGRQEENKHDAASPIEDDIHSYKEGGIEDARELNLNKSASYELRMSKSNEDAWPVDYQSEDKFVEEDAVKLYVDFPCLEAASPIADKDAASPIEDDTNSYKEGGIEDTHELNLNNSASDELKMSKSIEDARPVDYQSENKFVKEDADKLNADFPYLETASPIADKDETSPMEDDSHSYKEGGIEDAPELNLNNSASDELKMSNLVEDARPVICQSEDKFVEEDVDKLNAGAPYVETASPIADKDETSMEQEGGTEDAPELNLNESASDELKMLKSIEDATPVDYQPKDKFVNEDADKVYADLPCLEVASPIADKVAEVASPIADKVVDLSEASPIADKVVASPTVDDTHSYKDSGIEDAHELNLNESASDELKMRKSVEDTRPIDYQSDDKFVEEDAGEVYADLPCLEAATSTKETDADNSTKMADEVESINGADMSSMQFDQKDEMVCEREATS